jgi:predicted DCC family thiol-disulfide oxidoreductase YuxK
MPDWDLKILYDGECPVCRREASMLRRLDRGRGRLAMEDITSPGFDPSCYGTTQEAVMGKIHGVLPSGRLITGMDVFRRAYSAVGLGFLMVPTRWPILRPLSEAAYRWFARNRLRLTGRSKPACDTGRCRIH